MAGLVSFLKTAISQILVKSDISVQTCQNRLIIRQVIDKSDKYDIIMLVIAVVQEVLRAARPWGYTRGNLTFLAELSRNEQK